MKNRIGKLQRATRRALIYSDAQPVTTRDILSVAYPRQGRFLHWQYKDARRAAVRFATPVGRSDCGKGRAVIWVPRPELQRAIKGEE
jgi:hypothetical protein